MKRIYIIGYLQHSLSFGSSDRSNGWMSCKDVPMLFLKVPRCPCVVMGLIQWINWLLIVDPSHGRCWRVSTRTMHVQCDVHWEASGSADLLQSGWVLTASFRQYCESFGCIPCPWLNDAALATMLLLMSSSRRFSKMVWEVTWEHLWKDDYSTCIIFLKYNKRIYVVIVFTNIYVLFTWNYCCSSFVGG